MKFFNTPALATAALLSIAVALPFVPSLRIDRDAFALEVSLTSTKPGNVQLFWDGGGGYSEGNSSVLPISGGGSPAVFRLRVPPGVYRSLRFDPIDGDGTVVIRSARMVDRGNHTIRLIHPGDFRAMNQIRALTAGQDSLAVDVIPGGNDPQLLLLFQPRLVLYNSIISVGADLAPRAAAVFAVLAAILWGAERARRTRERIVGAGRSIWGRPILAIALVSVLAVVVSSYPVIFGGRSFVAPNNGDVQLLYDGIPTLPTYDASPATDVKGSDVGAIFWSHIPISTIQHRALLRDLEWPLWNRYDSCGTPLLGQGQSMFGDPLQLVVIAADGAAWALDFKFLAYKFLMAFGLGLLVLSVTQRTSAAALVSLAAPFFGFFVYRINHPAFFSFCCAPWPLYFWVRVSGARGLRSAAGWAAMLLLANLTLMNSGTVKEAYMLLLAMNFSGLCVLLAAEQAWGLRLRNLAVISWGFVLLTMISAPFWMSFLETLRLSYTSYDAPSAFQIQPSLLLGAFDEALYRPLTHDEYVFNPSANFLILAGMLYFLASLRAHLPNRTAIALAASSLVPLALAFGLVPASWITQVPLLRNVAHIDNCFTCALIVLWSVTAGVGFSAAASRLGTKDGSADLAISGLLLFAVWFQFMAFGHAAHRSLFAAEPVFSALGPGQTLPMSLFVGCYLASLLIALAAMGWLARRWLRTGTLTCAAALGLVLCTWTLLWRQGLQPQSAAFADYTVHPGPRPDFHVTSQAIDRMREGQASGPSRGIGIKGSFGPGWTAVYGLEGVTGPDALINPFYRELTGLSPVPRVWDWRLYLTRNAVPAARPFLDFLNVRYYFSAPVEGPLDSGLLFDGHYDLDTYESPTVWPRAFYTNRVAVYENPADLVGLVLRGDGRPFAAAQNGESAGSLPAEISSRIDGRVVIPASGYALTERTTSFSIHASGPGVVVLSEAYWPGYSHAEVDGATARVVRLNHAFQGIVIDKAGDYAVKFSYRPRWFGISESLAAIGLALLAFSLIAARRRGRLDLEAPGDR
jgi:hypothetical protein